MFKNIFVWLIYCSWKEAGVRLQDALIRKAAPIPTGSKRTLSHSARHQDEVCSANLDDFFCQIFCLGSDIDYLLR